MDSNETHELHFSDSEEEDSEEERSFERNHDDQRQRRHHELEVEAEDSFLTSGDYSSRMEEIMDEDEDDGFKLDSDEDEDVGEGFVYSGVDAPSPGSAGAEVNYKQRLREVLGQDELTDNEEEMHKGVSSGVGGGGGGVGEVDLDLDAVGEDEHIVHRTHSVNSNSTPSTPRVSVSVPIPRKATAKPFLHPNISRLRSRFSSSTSTPESPFSLTSSSPSSSSQPHGIHNLLSRVSSLSNLSHPDSNSSSPQLFQQHSPHIHPQYTQSSSHGGRDAVVEAVMQSVEQDVFKWTNLQNITKEVFASNAVKKAMTVLGARGFETPTVLAANGYVCIGTSDGKILVYDFRQNLKCICGDDSPENRVGAVTALALSHDHTCVAAGHATGHIQIFNLTNPITPIRSVPPTSLSLVYSGRKEGHIHGSRIISIGFVAGRHTAVVSADIHGLAFYHSLGKVLFVEASDILRILGRYPDPPQRATRPSSSSSSHSQPQQLHQLESHPPRAGGTHTTKQRNPRYTILTMSPLPLGTSPHVTDGYSLVAMLTPTKLVVVGLKPSPKTWFKVSRGLEEGGEWRSQAHWRGTMAWFPSVFQDSLRTSHESGSDANGTAASSANSNNKRSGKGRAEEQGQPGTPVLAFSWGTSLRVIKIEEVKVKQVMKNAKTGKEREIEVGAVDYREVASWNMEEEILAVQWLSSQQLVVIAVNQIGVYDLQAKKMIERVEFDSTALMSPTIGDSVNGKMNYQDSVREISHSVRIYKGKVFLLGRNDIRVGTLLTWADRILSLVEDGDFLSAIELARAYYLDEAPGNRNGLPTDPALRKEVIGDKLQDLMVASARYAFSEDRMTDSTHVTPDGRGVDRTVLFESLVTTSSYACIALDDTEFLFEELFQKYDDSGIAAIYLRHLEPFVLDNKIRYVPPRITQRLIGLHEEDGRPDLVERVIWHIDPACLDINQAIQLCQKHHLYDALIYVYTRALRDYEAPIVEFLGLIRKVLIYRRTKAEKATGDVEDEEEDGEAIVEPMIVNSFKVYPYLSHILSGLTYPSGEPLPEDEAIQAKKDIYTFLFYGRSSVWPPGEGGKLILTSDDESGAEPTYPYIRQLLQWDAESFLHSLDIAFEDAHLHDESQSINRLIIVRILLELVSSLSPEDATFVHIFVARNTPKYPHYLANALAPSVLHKTLVHLSQEGGPENREDRQLATEYLLSAYRPHDTENTIALFEEAGFYRILQTWHRQDRRWDLLFLAYLDDPDISSPSTFEHLDEVLTTGTQANKKVLPSALAFTVESSLERLLELGVAETALMLQKHLPHLHDSALDGLGDAEADHKRFIYLQALFFPVKSDDNTGAPPISLPSITPDLRHTFIDLQCRFYPQETVTVLQTLPPDFLEWNDITHICETNHVPDAVMWAYDARGEPQQALRKAVDYQLNLSAQVVQALRQPSGESPTQIDQALGSLRTIGRQGIDICLRRSQKSSDVDVPLEDIWFTFLNSQIKVVQAVSACQTPSSSPGFDDETKSGCLSELRSLVQNTFGALVSITSTSIVSFPRLFKRLASSTTSKAHSHYDEFRTILTGMLESYRSDGDMLMMTKQLVERDLFDTMASLTRQKARGWTLDRGVCARCRNPLSKRPFELRPDTSTEADASEEVSLLQIVVARTGMGYHSQCYSIT